MDAALREQVDRLATQEFSAYVAPSLRDGQGRAVLRLSMGRLLHTLVANMEAAVAQMEAQAAARSGSGSGSAGAARGSGGAARDSGGGGGGNGAGGAAGGPEGGDKPDQPRMLLFSGHDTTVWPLLLALGQEVDHWPPYASNLVFELWELPPPAAAARTGGSSSSGAGGGARAANKAAASSGSGSSGSSGSGGSRYAVRVLFNRQELDIPHCPKPGLVPSLQAFRSEVLGPFILSEADFREACRVSVKHDSSLPEPQKEVSLASAADDDED